MGSEKKVYDLSGDDFTGKPFTEVKVDVPKPEETVEPVVSTTTPPAQEPDVQNTKEPVSAEPVVTDTTDTQAQKDKPKADSSTEPAGDKKPNVYSTLGKFLKSDGLLPEDVEIPENADAEFVRTALRRAVAEPVEQQTREQVTREVLSELEAQGINDHHLNLALLAASGKEAFISETDKIRKYSEYKLDDLAESDNYEDTLVEVVRSMYADRGLKPAEIDRIIKAAQADDELDKIFEEEAVPYHKQKYNSIVEETRAQKQREIQLQKAKEKYISDTVTSVIGNKQIRGENLDENVVAQLQTDLFQPSEQLDYGNGQVYKVTPFQKFLAEFENDFEFKLYVYNKFKFGSADIKKITENIREEIEEELLLGLQTTADMKGDHVGQKVVQDEWKEKIQKGQIFQF